ncbi:MAG TPA: acyltransferase [Polyangiales bacterium]|nr:acyltransferase [Polyangiales bacterium]
MRYVTTVRQAELEGVYIGGSSAPATPSTRPRVAQAVDRDARVGPTEIASPASAVRERVESLDALRGLMALAVVVYHLGAWTRVFSGALRDAVIVLGVYSVEGFFVISGFCFFHLYGAVSLRGAELRGFYLKRFFRIAPLYYLALALSLALEPIYRAVFSWGRLLENLTLSFGFFHPNHSFVVGGWSIGLELVFYAALPALLWIGRRRWALYLLGALLIAWSLPFAFGKVQAAEELRRFHVYVLLPNHAFAFVLGAIVADLRRRSALRLPWPALLAALAALGWLALSQQPTVVDHFEVMVEWPRLRYVALCCAAVLLFAFARWPSTGLARPLALLGERSYALYLMHPIAWLLIRDSLPPALAPSVQAGLGLLAAFLLAELAHRVLERPALRFGQRLAAK